jgi:hypothetical protein
MCDGGGDGGGGCVVCTALEYTGVQLSTIPPTPHWDQDWNVESQHIYGATFQHINRLWH